MDILAQEPLIHEDATVGHFIEHHYDCLEELYLMHCQQVERVFGINTRSGTGFYDFCEYVYNALQSKCVSSNTSMEQ